MELSFNFVNFQILMVCCFIALAVAAPSPRDEEATVSDTSFNHDITLKADDVQTIFRILWRPYLVLGKK